MITPDDQLNLFKNLPEKKFDFHLLTIQTKKKKISLLQRRLYAFYVDFFAAIFFAKASILSYWMILKVAFPFLSMRFQTTMLKSFTEMEIAMIAITFFGHHVLSHVFKYGQTLGKYVFELSTIDPQNPLQEVTISKAVTRSFVLSATLFVMPFLILFPFIRKDRRAVHCWLTGIETVSLRQSKEFKSNARQIEISSSLNQATQIEMELTIYKIPKPQTDQMLLPMAA